MLRSKLIQEDSFKDFHCHFEGITLYEILSVFYKICTSYFPLQVIFILYIFFSGTKGYIMFLPILSLQKFKVELKESALFQMLIKIL